MRAMKVFIVLGHVGAVATPFTPLLWYHSVGDVVIRHPIFQSGL